MASKDRMSGNLDVGRFNPGTGLLRPSGGIVVTDEATMARSLQDMDNTNFNQKQAMNATVPEGGLRMVRPDGQVVVSSGSGKDGSYGVSRLGSGDRRLSDVAYTLNGVPVSSAEAEERQKAIDGTGDVWGRRDRAVAEQRNQNEIANSNYLRTPVATRQRQDAIDDQARAADTARYVADRGVDAAEAGAQGKQGGADAYSRQMADQMEKMAKAAEAAGDSDQAKWIREQMGEFFKRGISQGTDKKGNPLPPREPTVDETDQFNQLITGLANPVQPEQVKQAAGDKVRAWSRLSPEQQAQVLADPNQSASLKASAQLMWNTAQKADERTYQGMMKHPAMGLVKQILGKE